MNNLSNEDTARLDSMSGRIVELERQLAAAQAAIWRHNEEDAAVDCEAIEFKDRDALDAAIAEATKPLCEALIEERGKLAAAQAMMKEINDLVLWIKEPELRDEDKRAAKIAAIIDDTLHGKHAALDAAIAAALEAERIATAERLDQQLAKAISAATKELRDQLSDCYRLTHLAIATATKPLVEMLERVFELYPHLTEIPKLLAQLK